MSLDSKTIEAIHRLTHEQKLSHKQVAHELHVSSHTIQKYLRNPSPPRTIRAVRYSKLDSFKPIIRELMAAWLTTNNLSGKTGAVHITFFSTRNTILRPEAVRDGIFGYTSAPQGFKYQTSFAQYEKTPQMTTVSDAQNCCVFTLPGMPE